MINKKPQIGIVGSKMGENSFGATFPYLIHLTQVFGADVHILLPTESIFPWLDLVVLPGGKDVSPHLYGQVPGFFNTDTDQFKEAFLKTNLQKYIDAGIPIWGTCLGFQQLIVHFGGNLVQNIGPGHGYGEERGDLVNQLKFNTKFNRFELECLFLAGDGKKPAKKIEVSSLHHQGALEENVPDCFDILAVNKDDDIVEVIRHKTLPIAAMQCHPEEDYNVVAYKLISKLISKSPNVEKIVINETKGDTISVV